MNRIKKRRAEAGLLQQDVAKALGVSRSAYTKWERGDAEPKVTRLKALADLFGCPVSSLIEDFCLLRQERGAGV